MITLMISTQETSRLGRRSCLNFPRMLALVGCVILVLVLGVILSPPLACTMARIQRRFPPLLVNRIVAIVFFVLKVVEVFVKAFNKVFNRFC